MQLYFERHMVWNSEKVCFMSESSEGICDDFSRDGDEEGMPLFMLQQVSCLENGLEYKEITIGN